MVARWLVLSVCLLVLIAGCGGDSDNGDNSSDAPTATTASSAPSGNTPADEGDEEDAAGGGEVTFQVVRGARPGSTADVVVIAPPSAQCEITYTAPDGQVGEMRGLEPKTASGNGRVSWGWKIDTDTPSGEGTVSVTCDGTTAETTIPIH